MPIVTHRPGDAPPAVPVYREEIWEAVKQENEAVARAAGDALPKLPPDP